MTLLPTPGVCRVCGCSEAFACDCGCAWANPERTLCTRCADPSPALQVAAGFGWMAELLQAHGGQLGGLQLITPGTLPRATTYRILHGIERDAILCTRCGAISHHPQDVTQRYCGRCRLFHEDGTL